MCVHTQERLQQALLQWQHPAGPLPPSLLAAQGSASTGAAAAAAAGAGLAAGAGDKARGDAALLLLRERVQQWREALRGAHAALRHGHCPVLYVCGQVSGRGWDSMGLC
jgi:alkanesulfonate monooxygenase SsuD/methylene tetrahydromethanopterin reductase-like flavin-dependent oxidoreductase (luciferase family)